MRYLKFISLTLLAVLVAACGDDNSTGPSGPYTLTVTNSTDKTILSFSISLNSESDAGDDRLGADGALEPGEIRTFQIDAKGTYDLIAVDSDFSSYARIAIKIKSDTTWNITDDDCFLCE